MQTLLIEFIELALFHIFTTKCRNTKILDNLPLPVRLIINTYPTYIYAYACIYIV